MTQNVDTSLDSLDLMILRELESDGRQSVSDLSKKLGISRAYAGKKLQRLLDRQCTRIATFTEPLVLGYQATAIMGLQVSPKEIYATSDKLRNLPNVHMVAIVAGRYDILIMVFLQTPADLPIFLQRDLGTIQSIKSVETNLVVRLMKLSFSYLELSRLGSKISQGKGKTGTAYGIMEESMMEIDETDLNILRELETDGRQSVSDLSRDLGLNRAHVAVRLQRLLDHGATRIVAFNNPLFLGYNTFAMIGIKVSPDELHAAADQLRDLKDVFWLALVAGTYDIIIWTMFPAPMDLSGFLGGELGGIAGIASIETMIGLELRKMSLHRMVTSHMQAEGNRKKATI